MSGRAQYDGAPIAVIGNGPVGQTTALLLVRWGIPTVLLDSRDSRDLVGSKAICQQRDVLDIWGSVGVGRQVADEGVTWTVARTFHRDRELKPTDTGWDVSRIAAAWIELMTRLGYEKWAAQGGDWGAVVTTAVGAMRPEGLLGVHLNTQYAFPAQIPDTLSPEERNAVDTLALYTGYFGGSNHLQSTKPETVGFALADSPAGQAAWIYEKFQSKTDNHGLAEDALSTDDMLDAISLYWFTNSAASSGRIYWENSSGTLAGPKLILPVAVTVFPRDIPRLPRSWIEDTYANLIHYGEADKGGHFAAFEQPEILVNEIRTGLRSLRF